MVSDVNSKRAATAGPRRAIWAAVLPAALIVLAALAAYHNSFAGPFIFDDTGSIEKNPTIRSLWRILRVLSPPPGMTVAGRPLINLSLAVNYAISGLETWSYHVLNLAVHVLGGLVLFGVVRRTLLLDGMRERFGGAAVFLALAVSLIWVVHPLQTESVTYVIQRAESIVGLFYLLTIYCLIRGATGPRANVWYVLAVVCCFLGMTSKEVMASAPVIALLYDRAFLAGSFAQALRKRWKLYAAMAATWLLLALLVVGTGGRGAFVETTQSVSAWSYMRAQFYWVCHYLRLTFWPDPLVLDYGEDPSAVAPVIWPFALVVVVLLGGALWAIWRRPKLGVPCAFFFAVLAPTSSVVPVVTQVAAEHRMYLALAAVAVLVVMAGYSLWRRWKAPSGAGRWLRLAAPAAVLAAAVVALAVRTTLRNEDYRSELAIWQLAAKDWPGNPRAHYGVGLAFEDLDQLDKAIERYRRALELKEDDAGAHNALGGALHKQGKLAEAIGHLELAVRYDPYMAEAHFNLAVALERKGDMARALKHYRVGLKLMPDSPEARTYLAAALAKQGNLAEAAELYLQAVQANPDDAEARARLGEILASQGSFAEAAVHLRRAVQLKPDHAVAHCNLGVVQARQGDVSGALEHLHRAMALKSDYIEAMTHIGAILGMQGKPQEAMEYLRQAIRIKPDYADAHINMGVLFATHGKLNEAVACFQRAARISPDDAGIQMNLARAFLGLGDAEQAAGHLEQALRIKGDFFEAARRLAWLLATHPALADRDPQRAIELAGRACELTRWTRADCLDALAAAYANAGRFSEAAAMAQRAIGLAERSGSPQAAGEIRERLRLYQAGKAYRQP